MDPQEARAAITKPQVNRLKDLGMGLRMGKVFGRRVLVQPITPFTEMERLEKEGTLYIPQTVKDSNKPMPSTGIVLQLGLQLEEEFARMRDYGLPVPLQTGDAIMFSKYAGIEAVIDQVDYRIIQFDEVMCTLEATNPEAYAVVTDAGR